MQWQRKAALIEPFLIAKVVLCWIVALPIFALCLSGVTVWDKAAFVVRALRASRYQSRFHLKRVRVSKRPETRVVQQRCTGDAKPLRAVSAAWRD